LTQIGLQDIAKQDLLDFSGLNARSLHGRLDGMCSELNGGLRGQRALEHAAWCTDGGEDVDGFGRSHIREEDEVCDELERRDGYSGGQYEREESYPYENNGIAPFELLARDSMTDS
jgi:hypothetical protein